MPGEAGTAAAPAATGGETAEQTQAQTNGKPTVAVKIYAPFRIYYEGAAYSISAINATGPFDILPRHHNFLCLLMPCDIIVHTPQGVKIVRITRALMHVKADKVTVFVDI